MMSRDDYESEDAVPDEALVGEAFVIEDLADNESETITCTSCQREVYEDAAVCPYCHEIILAPTGYPPWVIAVAIVLLAVLGITMFWFNF